MTAYEPGYKFLPEPNPRCGVWAEPTAYVGPMPPLMHTVRRSCLGRLTMRWRW